jgi:type I restriction enzyme S subunit
LGDVVQINPRVGTERASADLPVSFVPMAAVCEHTGRIVSSDVRPFGQVSKGFPIFAENDVLFAKITPCMENGKAAIARNLENGTGAGSTEFFVLRPTGRILSEYVFHFIRRTSFRATCKANFTGSAGQQRVPKSFLEKVAIPLPPVEEQRRIVGLLDRAAEIRRRADAARAKARAIIPALFLDMFGDPATNPKGWPMVTVGDLLQSAAYGTSQKANDRGEGIPMIRMGNVTTGGQLDTIDLKHIAISGLEREKAELLEGDLLFNRTNSKELVGKTGLWDGRFEAVAASYFIRLRVKCDLSSPSYLWAFFNTRYMKRALFDTARGAIGQANINAKELRAFRVAVPPFDLQEAFAEQVQRLEALARHLDAIAAKAETMAAGLSAEVFDAGERKASVDGSLASC